MVPGQKKDIGKDEEFVDAKTDFLLAVCRGFADNLPADKRHTFERKVYKWAGESLPDSNNPRNHSSVMDNSYDTRTASEGPM